MDEIEAKYLLRENGTFCTTPQLRQAIIDDHLEERIRAGGRPVLQGYLPLAEGVALGRRHGLPEGDYREARLRRKGDIYTLTLKGAGDAAREEEEAVIDEQTFLAAWPATAGRRVKKIRLQLPWHGYTAELDLYTGGRDLITAEVEVPTEAELARLIPLGRDITADKRYKNRNLAR